MKKILPVFLVVLLLSGCFAGEATESDTVYLTAMDTVMSLTAYGENRQEALELAQQEILRLDAMLSTGKPDSEVSRLNSGGTGNVSEDTRFLLEKSLELFAKTNGLFDISIYPLVQLWGFYDESYHVPTQQELAETLPLIGADRIRLSGNAVTLGAGQAIDLGAIGKGYTSQRVTDILHQAGVTSAMISLGGNVQCLGTKPDGTKWNIGIRNPWDPDAGVCCIVQVEDRAVITSGGYERNFTQDGTTYLHILDPRTGFPADSGLSSVSIISRDGTLGDGLSTALFIMGLENAATYYHAHSQEFDAVFLTQDGQLYATPGLRGSIQSDMDIQYLQ